MANDEVSTDPEVGAKARRAHWKRVRKLEARCLKKERPPAGGGALYGLGMIGALVYFMGSAQSPRDYFVAFAKSTVWPAILVYRAFKVLGE